MSSQSFNIYFLLNGSVSFMRLCEIEKTHKSVALKLWLIKIYGLGGLVNNENLKSCPIGVRSSRV